MAAETGRDRSGETPTGDDDDNEGDEDDDVDAAARGTMQATNAENVALMAQMRRRIQQLEASEAASRRRFEASQAAAEPPPVRLPDVLQPWWMAHPSVQDGWRLVPPCVINPSLNASEDTTAEAEVRRQTRCFWEDLVSGQWFYPSQQHGGYSEVIFLCSLCLFVHLSCT
jgi:hypothetical protein